MIKPTDQILRALGSLEGNNNFDIVVSWFEESLREQSIMNNRLSGEIAIKGQGRGLELIDILKHISNKEKYLAYAKEAEKFEKR